MRSGSADAQVDRDYFVDIEYPLVSRILCPHIEHDPLLKAQSTRGREVSVIYTVIAL